MQNVQGARIKKTNKILNHYNLQCKQNSQADEDDTVPSLQQAHMY